MSKNLFEIIPPDFFKPLTSKYKRIYSDAILLLFNTFKPEITYGVNREIAVKVLTDYFETDDDEISFDDETYVSDSRDKANGVILTLKKTGWLEYEQAKNHQIEIALFEYTIPIIESMNRIITEEETEYQGLISQIHSTLRNEELYSKPYELIITGVKESTDRLVSELKRLSISIKRHMDKQTNDMDANELLEHFFKYHQNIGSKAYLRMKTGDNVAYFRSAIIERLEYLMERQSIMDRAVKGYMEVKQVEDSDLAYDNLVSDLMDIKSSFYRLDDIIDEIDKRHMRYMRNAVRRAEFLLATGNNQEGKISKILHFMAEDINENDIVLTDVDERKEMTPQFSLYSQRFISPESLKTVPVKKEMSEIEQLQTGELMSEEMRLHYKEALKQKNRRIFTRKNINDYVRELLKKTEKLPVTDLEVNTRRDLIRIIYISIYAGNRSNCYRIKRSEKRVKLGEYTIPYFEIIAAR